MKKLSVLLLIGVLCFSMFPLMQFASTALGGAPDYTFYTPASDSYIYQYNDNYSQAWTSWGGVVVPYDIVLGLGQSSPSFGIGPAKYEIWRSFLYFNTTSLPTGLSIRKAVVTLCISNLWTDTDFNITVQNGQPTCPHDPTQTSDFDKAEYSGIGGQQSTVGLTEGFNDVVLNPTGIGWINAGGWTKFCLRSDRDINGIPPTNAEHIGILASEYDDGSYRARLNIYTHVQTWVVDDDGPADFNTIQEAINAASEGDTVFVRSGTYYEHVVVNKTLTLQGENRDATIVDGEYLFASVVIVAANNVKLSGFTIQHCMDGGRALWLDNYVNMTFSDNLVKGNNEGIRILNSHGNVISYNIVQDCYYNTGIGFDWAYNNTVHRNTIIHNHYGLSGGYDNHNNTYSENTIINNDIGFGTNMYDDKFFHNSFVSNGVQVIASGTNQFDDGYPSGGNYWSDYAGVDANGDGIGDTPYIIDSNNRDNYPLMHLWNGSIMPLAHLSLQPQDCMLRFMRTFTVNVTIANVTNLYGYEFKVHWNETLLDLVSVSIAPPEAWGSSYIVIKNDVTDSTYWHSLSALAPAPAFNGSTTLVSLTFNVTYSSALQSLYNSTVETYVTLDETILADTSAHAIAHDTGNCKAHIRFVMMGDLNGDKAVNILDVVKVAVIYGHSGTPGWTIEDINCDGHITILDIVLVTINYGKKV